MRKDLPKHPFFADKNDLESCLSALGERPLKLIADSLYNDETIWENQKWHFQKDAEGMKKDVLVNREDSFQVSVADSHTKQDYHVHDCTLEIYVSDFPMKLHFNETETMGVEKSGFLIVPPKVEHKVELSGFTYVLQTRQGKLPIHKDKRKIKKP